MAKASVAQVAEVATDNTGVEALVDQAPTTGVVTFDDLAPIARACADIAGFTVGTLDKRYADDGIATLVKYGLTYQ
jgi:glutamate/tyrosine decarboxylase-like PLP-dependent enzyme